MQDITQKAVSQTFKLVSLMFQLFPCTFSLFVFFYLDPQGQSNTVIQHLRWLSFSCKKKEGWETQGGGGSWSVHESGRKQHRRIHIISLFSVTPRYRLAYAALSKVPSISIPPSSLIPPSPAPSSSGFISLCSLRFQSVEIRVKGKNSMEQRDRKRREREKKKEKGLDRGVRVSEKTEIIKTAWGP